MNVVSQRFRIKQAVIALDDTRFPKKDKVAPGSMLKSQIKRTIRYWISNASESTSLKQLLSWTHTRWALKQSYQQLKEELGLDHFEGGLGRG